MKKILLPAALLLSLSACGLFHREGVGFTGIDGEPKTVTATKGSADYVARRLSVPAELAGLPKVRLQTDSIELKELAEVAIANGGRSPSTAVEVGQGTQNLYLSMVQVNGTNFAVLRTAENEVARMQEGSGSAFVASVPRLTGCLTAGSAYQAGSGRRATGLAVPLNCS